MSEDHDDRGRFKPGNAARRRRQRVLSPYQVAQLLDRKLAEVDQHNRTLEDHVVEIWCLVFADARKGDAAARRLVLEYFAPPEKHPRISIGKLPKPSKDPLGFLDRLAAAVTAGKLSVDDAAKLSRLAGPIVGDQVVRDSLERLAKIEARLAQLTELRVVR